MDDASVTEVKIIVGDVSVDDTDKYDEEKYYGEPFLGVILVVCSDIVNYLWNMRTLSQFGQSLDDLYVLRALAS
jgi:hypothetical protein